MKLWLERLSLRFFYWRHDLCFKHDLRKTYINDSLSCKACYEENFDAAKKRLRKFQEALDDAIRRKKELQ